MNIAQKNEKMVKADSNGQTITVTHITIRQSIFFLILKLFVVEILAAVGFISLFATLLSQQLIDVISTNYYGYVIPAFILIVAIKTGIMVYIVDEWLEEFYEINPREVIHKKGQIFRHEEHYPLKHLGVTKVEQGTLGRIFNYGTITLFDWVANHDVVLYLIHNPLKYHNILKELLPEADVEKKVLREEIFEEDI